MMLGDGMTMILLSVYFRYISKEWIYFQIYGIILLGLASIAVFWVPESPKFLYSLKKYDAARISLIRIAISNRKPLVIDEILNSLFENEKDLNVDALIKKVI